MPTQCLEMLAYKPSGFIYIVVMALVSFELHDGLL